MIDKPELPDGLYSISGIHDYFEYINNSPAKIDVNKTENRITSNTKAGYYLELLTPETMKVLGSTEKKINENKKWWKRASITT